MGCSDSKVHASENHRTVTTHTQESVAVGDTQPGTTRQLQEDGGSQSVMNEDVRFTQAALQAHTRYRKTHQAAPLELSEELCSMAQGLCRRLAAARTFCNSDPEERIFEGQECGENLFRHWGGEEEEVTAEMACQSWYDEVDNYHHDMPGFDLATCHFTQMVWKESTKFGIARTYYDDDDGFRKYIVVANYYPAGNIDGAYEENVIIPQGFFDS